MAIKRVVVESDLKSRPFLNGETLFTYAKRILEEEGLNGMILDVRSFLAIVDVTTHESWGRGGQTVCNAEIVEIEVRTAAMLQ